MGVVYRRDRGTFGAAERTPQGGYAIPAFLTRTGVFEYEQPDGKVIREYRPPEEVFNADSLATLPNATLCNEHPTEPIDPTTFRRHVVGHVDKDVKQDGDKIAARVIVQDARAIKAIDEQRKREISCGYQCDVEEVPGVTADGERYDRVQRRIRYNHVAIVEDGRAGPDVRLRLDSSGNQTEQRQTMKVEIISGVEYEVGSPAHAEAVRQRDVRRRQRHDARTKVAAQNKAAFDKLSARADAAENKVKQLTAQLKQLSSPERFDHAVRVRGAVVRRAAIVLGQFKADGLTNQAIKIAAVKKAFPQIKLDGKSADYVNALFRTIAPQPGAQRTPQRIDSRNQVHGVPDHLRNPPPGFQRSDGGQTGGGRTLAQIRADRDESQRHRVPLAVSKSNPHRETDGFPAIQGSMLETMR